MTSVAQSGELVVPSDDLFDEAQLAVAGFLARYKETTRNSYATDLRAWFRWCAARELRPLEVKRPHIELWAREMSEVQKLAPGTLARRISTVAGYYRFAAIDGYIDTSPAEHLRRPRVHGESTTLGLNRAELGAFIYSAAASTPADHTRACLLGLLGLRVSEACGVNIEDFDEARGHRILRLIGKGDKPATIPLPPRIARATDLAAGERRFGALLLSRAGTRLSRHCATRIVRRLAKAAGIDKHITPHSLRQSYDLNLWIGLLESAAYLPL